MDNDKLSGYAGKGFFVGALVLFVVAVVGWVMTMAGAQLGIGYRPGRLVEFAAMFLVPVIAVLLRQIREELRKQRKP